MLNPQGYPSRLFRHAIVHTLCGVMASACTSVPPKDIAVGPRVKSSIAGLISIPADRRANGVFAEVVDNKQESACLQRILKEAGLRVLDVKTPGAYHLVLTTEYLGPAGARPAIGSEAARPSKLLSLIREALFPSDSGHLVFMLLPGAWWDPTFVLDRVGRAVGAKDAVDRGADRLMGRPVSAVEVRREPIDALLTRAQLIDEGGMQTMRILSESFSPDTTSDDLAADNLRVLVRVLE